VHIFGSHASPAHLAKDGSGAGGPDGPFRDALAPGLPGGKDLSHSSLSASELAGPSKKHQCHSPPTMLRKQVSGRLDSLDSPVVAAEAEQVERTLRKTWSRARYEVFVPHRLTGSQSRPVDPVDEVAEAGP
jgi:hypothetical protein